MTQEEEAAIVASIASGKLVDAIKLVRAATGVSLSDARAYVMTLAGSLPHDRQMQRGFRAAIALSEPAPRRSALATAVVATIVVVLIGFAGVAVLLAHTRIVPD